MKSQYSWWRTAKAEAEKAVISTLLGPVLVVVGVGILVWDKISALREGQYD